MTQNNLKEAIAFLEQEREELLLTDGGREVLHDVARFTLLREYKRLKRLCENVTEDEEHNYPIALKQSIDKMRDTLQSTQ